MNSLTGGAARNTEQAPTLSSEKEDCAVDLSSGLVNPQLASRVPQN